MNKVGRKVFKELR
jgi:hypothetical protein